MKIIPDTNFLIYLSRFKLLDQLGYFNKILLLKPVLQELIILSKNKKEKSEDQNSSKIVLEFFEKIKDKIDFIDSNDKADDAIIKIAKKEKIIVGTMDKELKKRLKQQSSSILIIRQKKFLEEE
jgi:uncharacterized protein